MRRAVSSLSAGLMVLLVLGASARADDEARLVRATPSVVGENLVCHLKTDGLPGDKQLQSMQSGLVASVDLDLALEDEQGNILGGNSLSLRLGFDLWEEVFSVRADGRERRFQNLDDLKIYLAEISNLPVAPATLLAASGNFRLRVGLTVNSIAPDEQARVEDVIAGDRRPRREGQDQQETSVSLGRLIRLFYKGGGEVRDGLELESPWFTRKELADAKN